MTTQLSKKEFKCTLCHRRVHVNDEMGFTEIRNQGRDFNVPICLDCYDREMRNQAGAYDE